LGRLPIVTGKFGQLSLVMGSWEVPPMPSSSENLLDAVLTSGTRAEGVTLLQKIRELSTQHWGKGIAFVGNHPQFCQALQKLEQFAQSDEPVLITGESGVGKELFARSLFVLSRRKDAPYVSINCGQFSDEHLMVSELFGHVKGSFTGALGAHPGVFETADKGTILLDEAGELSMGAQKMLLRVIEQKEIKPLGATEIKTVDIRVVSATHRNLQSLVDSGVFREDLFYRLNCLPVHIPSLRERGDDRLLLLEHFLARLNEAHGVGKQFSHEALEFLRQYSYPGNIRELRNIVETGFRMSRGEIIQLDDVITHLQNRRKSEGLFFDMSDHYLRMKEGHESFWEVIRKPFLRRDLNRVQVQAIIRRGLQEAGSYKEVLKVFNVPAEEHKAFLNFLQTHELRP
jgi:DNA-binding NtrC family response regulator